MTLCPQDPMIYRTLTAARTPVPCQRSNCTRLATLGDCCNSSRADLSPTPWADKLPVRLLASTAQPSPRLH